MRIIHGIPSIAKQLSQHSFEDGPDLLTFSCPWDDRLRLASFEDRHGKVIQCLEYVPIDGEKPSALRLRLHKGIGEAWKSAIKEATNKAIDGLLGNTLF